LHQHLDDGRVGLARAPLDLAELLVGLPPDPDRAVLPPLLVLRDDDHGLGAVRGGHVRARIALAQYPLQSYSRSSSSFAHASRSSAMIRRIASAIVGLSIMEVIT